MVLVGLGSNLGDREAQLEAAVRLVARHPAVRWRRISRWRETEPVGGPPQGKYLNGAGELVTTLDPWELLAHLQSVEEELGRVRTIHHGPRTIDIDMLTYGQMLIDDERLRVPHPRITERPFVLEPLAEVAPDGIHPATGRTFREHWEECLGAASRQSRRGGLA